jgi:hypothetical protein
MGEPLVGGEPAVARGELALGDEVRRRSTRCRPKLVVGAPALQGQTDVIGVLLNLAEEEAAVILIQSRRPCQEPADVVLFRNILGGSRGVTVDPPGDFDVFAD